MVFLGAIGVLLFALEAAKLERDALRKTGSMALMLAVLAVVWICIRWTTVAMARREEPELRFDEEAPPAVQGLGLYRDGVMTIVAPQATRTP